MWHRPERTLPLPPEGGDPNARAMPPSGGSSPGTPPLGGSGSASPFLGWHERGYLPHFDAPYVTQFVTFMLQDAFPVTRRREWESILNEPDDSERRRNVEAWLDRAHGQCWLRRPDLAALVEEKLREGDGKTYRLQAWAIMPNHLHLVLDVWAMPLSKLLMSVSRGNGRLPRERGVPKPARMERRIYAAGLRKKPAVLPTRNIVVRRSSILPPRPEAASAGTPDLSGRAGRRPTSASSPATPPRPT